jgi:hypothetical protein
MIHAEQLDSCTPFTAITKKKTSVDIIGGLSNAGYFSVGRLRGDTTSVLSCLVISIALRLG